MGESSDTDGVSITEAAKRAGAEAFSKAMRTGIYDLLRDEELGDEILALWDCESVGELQACAASDDQSAGVTGILLQKARAEFLAAVCAVLGVRQIKKRGRGR